MSMRDVIEEVRKRLDDADFNVHLGYLADPKIDQLPLVAVYLSENVPQHNKPAYVGDMTLVLEYHARERVDPLLAMVDAAELMRDTVIQSTGMDVTERLGGAAHDVQHVRDVGVMRERDIYTVQTILRITYS